MSGDPRPVSEPAEDSAVMASIDESRDGARLVIADLSQEESWLSAPLDSGRVLTEWR